jgi:prolyl-tRNA synthetase
MRLSQLATPSPVDDVDHSDVLAAAGFTNFLADGIYSLLPLGQRVMSKVMSIVHAELQRAGAQQVSMSLLQPEQLWQHPDAMGLSRAEAFGRQLFRLRGEPLVLAPTHEEAAAVIAASSVRDLKNLPYLIYQIQPRFRNQVSSPAAPGLLQTREFLLADAYSFHADQSGLDETYPALRQALRAVTTRCGLETQLVAADSGVMGGTESEEIIAPIRRGPLAAVKCHGCGYAASAETATTARSATGGEPEPAAEVEASHIDAGRNRLGAIPFLSAHEVVLAVLPVGRFMNAAKLLHAVNSCSRPTAELHPASAQELHLRGANFSWVSLIHTPAEVRVIADESVRGGSNFTYPSPRTGQVLINLNWGRDFRVDAFADLTTATDNDPCPHCHRSLRAVHGVEVGHVFKLGSRYTMSLGAEIAGARGDRQPLTMGCYGLGLTRLIAAVVEQRRDYRGIVWPEQIAPFLVGIVYDGEEVSERAERLYYDLRSVSIEALLMDSSASAAERMKHLDLLGIPYQLRVQANDDQVCFRSRAETAWRHQEQAAVKDFLKNRSNQ